MARQPLQLTWLRIAALMTAPFGLVCGGAHSTLSTNPNEGESTQDLLVRAIPDSPQTLTFPPPVDSSIKREPLDTRYQVQQATSKVDVVRPELSDERTFQVVGNTVRIVFNQPMTVADGKTSPHVKSHGLRSAAAGTIRLTPDVAGEAYWPDTNSLEFTAKAQFQPDIPYQIELNHLASQSGKPLEGWKASFTAIPSVTVGGKVLGYVPVVGQYKTIAAHPWETTPLSRTEELSVLYDQPIDLSIARTLIELTDEQDKRIPIVLDHPRSHSFQGVRVDPRVVVLIRPALPLKQGQKVTLAAKNRVSEGDRHSRVLTYQVADALEYTGVACGYSWDDEECDFDNGRLRPTRNQVHLRFNNPIDIEGRALESRVQVSPKVRNLSVHSESWDGGRIILSGAFESSTTYNVFISGVEDRYKNRLAQPIQFKIDVPPLGASATIAEGLLLLDTTTAKQFAVTTRNVLEGEILAWPLARNDASAYETALSQARTHQLPDQKPTIQIPFSVKNPKQDELVTTEVDLTAKLSFGTSYLVTVQANKLSRGAEAVKFPSGSEAERPNTALLTLGGDKSLAIHTRSLPGATLVYVARFGSGEPVASARVRFDKDDESKAVVTDKFGIALLDESSGQSKLRVEAGSDVAWLPLDEGGITAKQLFPDLAAGQDDTTTGTGASAQRGLILSDRGIYRPGSTVWIKASLRRPDADRLAPVVNTPVRVRVLGATGDEVYSELATTNDMGSVATKVELPVDEKLGRHQLLLEQPDETNPPLAQTIIQVAEFEPPRFAVDVDAAESAKGRIKATVRGRYLFGAPMDGAAVQWTLRREPAALPSGPMTDAGLVFRRPSRWYDDDDDQRDVWSRAGEGRLSADGTLVVDQALLMDGVRGPQAFVLEADVADSSYRHIAGRGRIIKHPAPRYAGLKTSASWVGVNESIPVELGVIDTQGQPVVGANVTARLERVDWHYSHRRGAGGVLRSAWFTTRSEVGRCAVKSARTPTPCSLRAPRSGDYEITAEVDGMKGGSASVWAWREGETQRIAFPDRGRTMEIVSDKRRYTPGDKAKLLVRNPFRAATAILTVEHGGLLSHQSSRIQSASAVFEVPLTTAHAPHVHATVTLLPIGEKGAAATDYRIGAVRLPVSLDKARLDLAIQSNKPAYQPGEEAEITVDVRDSGAPKAGAEIALAVVDEGVLRLTDFHAVDPLKVLHPGHGLVFEAHDSREGLADLLARSHVPGDGGGPERATIERTRKNFVETALWRPDLRTDASGRASVKFKLPDNLTQFRIMAVTLDADGKGASLESSFTVKKPLMLVPIVPRFAVRGDRFEVAAMLHNNTTDEVAATVRLGDRTTSVTVSGGGHSRVGFPFVAEKRGDNTLSFAVADGAGAVRDQVEAKLRVDEPGYEQRPKVSGSFAGVQEVSLDVPENIAIHGEQSLRIHVGQHLWPELGARLEYLLDYPHGCVEQTTSSTLPLIAARTILPRIGVDKMSESELNKRIRAGIERLHSMRTSSGGLAYWPGGTEPNVYGTAYAIRAVILARDVGVAPPRGMLEGMQQYLADRLLSSGVEPEVKAAIAQSLAELKAFPQSAVDALYDTREAQSVFGKASLAMAMASLPGQDDHVKALLDDLESSFDENAELKAPPGHDDFYYYGSPTRSRAQAATALARHRRNAKVLPKLLQNLVGETEAYTTQATSYALLAVATQLRETVSDGSAVHAWLNGTKLEPARDLGFGSKEFRIALSDLRGKRAALKLATDGSSAVGFQLSASWRRPLDAAESVAATRSDNGPSVYRVFTDSKGGSIDVSKVHAGDVVRVALLVELPDKIARERRGYIALTDRLPAGFEPIQPDLATVASVPDLDERHPFYSALSYGSSEASHVELHDDRVNVYFDRVWGDTVVATYLARASTPGEFVLPPAAAELMYEGGSIGYSDAGHVSVQ